ncbi:dolichyl-diphosphooligosaccharide-protein glycosyltransferase 48kD subunit [Microdochium trichocladiopsis]|uniref:Dolichyl-diphosphooligosaccharide--protein glycosyltransferase subunit WBP1 n=1 Tax=Microdochium trichocladiopsis TaxID=1682393 RepID=A0A9P8YEN3_9PEZI|nr:dolichyl-diphosphooligosaccharide-protein glycosyltransferase 48kD subunit [Microdochium trichocladiopsis]KAH7037611.1 dolichyl-diphosphooligosaccharide-protein glycosyltransferase 48kD subunit [Microdochium trichocladiopsis]
MRSFLSLAAVLLAAVANAASFSGDRLLVILEDAAEKAAYSKFLADLEGRGFDIVYESPKSEGLSLFHLGEKSYDHILLLPTKSKGLGPNLTPNALSQFMNAKGNILVALTSSTPASTSVVSLLNELDISLPAERTGLVVDHFNYDSTSAAEQHEVLLLPAPGSSRAGVKDLFSPAAPNGELIAFPNTVGQTLGSGALLAPILRAPSTAYSYNPKEESEVVEDLFASGQQLSLVTTFQARNSARFAVIGSAESLTDKWFDAKVKKAGEKSSVKTLNQEFAKLVSGWAFNEIGVLRVNSIEHHLDEAGASNASNPKIYRIKNDVTYSISLSEYSWDKWTPFTLPESDELQLEFSMLSAFHRLNLNVSASDESSTTYSTSFKLPDQHGIFNFLINYKRPFLSNVEEKNTVSVRHFAHDEWPRSFVISGAWPWLAGILATTTGWVAFCGIWLYSKPVNSGSASESKKSQ